MCAVRPVNFDRDTAGGRLKQVLGARALTAIGLGATIGTGIFVLTGTVAANNSGPAITLSLLISAFGAGLAALCYSEFAAFLPVPGQRVQLHLRDARGGAGLVHRLEPAARVRHLGIRGGGELVRLRGQSAWRAAHIHLPPQLVNAPLGLDAHEHIVRTGALINLPADAHHRRS